MIEKKNKQKEIAQKKLNKSNETRIFGRIVKRVRIK